MKTWEMIKELTENPEKKFKRVGDRLEVSVDIDDSLLWKSGHSPFNINHVWEEVKQPVTFMEVAEACRDGYHTVGLRCQEYEIMYEEWALDTLLADLAENYTHFELAEIILNGKWYIED